MKTKTHITTLVVLSTSFLLSTMSHGASSAQSRRPRGGTSCLQSFVNLVSTDPNEWVHPALIKDLVVSASPPSMRRHAGAIAHAVAAEVVRHRVNPLLVLAIIRQESNFHPHVVGAGLYYGLMQVHPATGRASLRNRQLRNQDLLSIETNIAAGVATLRLMGDQYSENMGLAVLAYAMGDGRLEQLRRSGAPLCGYLATAERRYRELLGHLPPDYERGGWSAAFD